MEQPRNVNEIFNFYKENIYHLSYARKHSYFFSSIIFATISGASLMPLIWNREYLNDQLFYALLISLTGVFIISIFLVRWNMQILKLKTIKEIRTFHKGPLIKFRTWISYYNHYIKKRRLRELLNFFEPGYEVILKNEIGNEKSRRDDSSSILILFRSPVHAIYIGYAISWFFTWIQTDSREAILATLPFYARLGFGMYCFALSIFLSITINFKMSRHSVLNDFEKELGQITFDKNVKIKKEQKEEREEKENILQ